jgi:hypothetical protein
LPTDHKLFPVLRILNLGTNCSSLKETDSNKEKELSNFLEFLMKCFTITTTFSKFL